MTERKVLATMTCVWLVAVLLLMNPANALRRPAQPLLARTGASRELRCSSQVEATTEKTKVPIGSAPEFAIAGDSTVETPYQRAVVAVHFLISGLNLYSAGTHLLPTVVSPIDYIPLLMTVLLSTVLGDLGTGIFHWSVDNYGDIKTPVFGAVCVAFQGHHDTPWTITFRSFCIRYDSRPTPSPHLDRRLGALG
jgi:Lipid desaturase domain